jgi:PEGA domain
MRFSIIAIILSAFSLSGCATITRGTSEELSVQTSPEGASVKLTGSGEEKTCVATPCTFKMPRRSNVVVLIEKEGFQTVRATVRGKLKGFVPAGPIGAVVDVASGAALKLQPNPLVVTLTPGTGEIEFVPPAPEAKTDKPK